MADNMPYDVPPARTLTRAAILGGLAAVLLGTILGVPLLYAAYRTGRARGAAAERERAFEKEIRVQEDPFTVDDDGRAAPARVSPVPGHRLARAALEDIDSAPAEAAKPPVAGAAGDVRTWVFGALECARVVWPMEIVPSGDGLDRPHFRLRQGANRFARRGTGLAEFVFEVAQPSRVGVYVRVRYSDECGNSIRCGIDGRRATMIGSVNIFGRWLWECAYRSFQLGAGLHRLTLGACEDGIAFDRVVIVADPAGTQHANMAAMESAPTTPPPVFDSMPAVSPTLPDIGPLEAGAFATGSIVAGEGHENRLVVYARLNGADRARGNVVVRCPSGGVYLTRPLELSPAKRSELMTFDLALRPRGAYLMPVRIEVFAEGRLVHSQRIDFVRPLEWAFLGPFPDPAGRGLDLKLHPDAEIARLQTLPEHEGRKWKVVRDGSCYDSLGLVDLNKVFGLDTVTWSRHAQSGPRSVAYAVTAISSHGSRHDVLALGGDDEARVWLNGRALLEARGRTPMELNRQVVGTALRRGANFFVFKVAQRGFFWKVLMEPDNGFPYGRTDNFLPLPVTNWPKARVGRVPVPGGAEVIVR